MHWCTWNCRGLRLSVPYIQSLLNEDIKILTLTENWLWLYQLHDLNNIHPCFLASGSYVKRLHEQAKWTRGCESVGIFWHRSLCVSWLEISSDRFRNPSPPWRSRGGEGRAFRYSCHLNLLWLKKNSNTIILLTVSNFLSSLQSTKGKRKTLCRQEAIVVYLSHMPLLEYALLDRIGLVIEDSGHPHF